MLIFDMQVECGIAEVLLGAEALVAGSFLIVFGLVSAHPFGFGLVVLLVWILIFHMLLLLCFCVAITVKRAIM